MYAINNILIVEDDKSLSNGIALSLKSEQYSFVQASSIGSAKQEIETSNIDLIILDINLPDGNGLDFLKEFRQTSQTPVIILTANDLESDIVSGFDLGADDYITKPFSLMILRARVDARLRGNHVNADGTISIDDYVFSFQKMQFSKKGVSIELSKVEQKLLRILIENKGLTLTRAILVDAIWSGGAEYVDENALSVTVKRLRDKIEDSASEPQYIKTVHGIGYTWSVK